MVAQQDETEVEDENIDNLMDEYPALKNDSYLSTMYPGDPLEKDGIHCENNVEATKKLYSETNDPSIPFGEGNVKTYILDCDDYYFVQINSGIIEVFGPFYFDGFDTDGTFLEGTVNESENDSENAAA